MVRAAFVYTLKFTRNRQWRKFRWTKYVHGEIYLRKFIERRLFKGDYYAGESYGGRFYINPPPNTLKDLFTYLHETYLLVTR